MRTKYRLLKDLPNIKAGRILIESNTGIGENEAGVMLTSYLMRDFPIFFELVQEQPLLTESQMFAMAEYLDERENTGVSAPLVAPKVPQLPPSIDEGFMSYLINNDPDLHRMAEKLNEVIAYLNGEKTA